MAKDYLGINLGNGKKGFNPSFTYKQQVNMDFKSEIDSTRIKDPFSPSNIQKKIKESEKIQRQKMKQNPPVEDDFEITLTNKVPEWIQYRREFEKNNPMGPYIYENRSRWVNKQDLIDKYERETNQYIYDQLIKNNPKRSGESRAEYVQRIAGDDMALQNIIEQSENRNSLWKLNPKNWGVKDYSDKGDFNTAYSAARKAGEKEFMWNGQRFSTKAYTDKNTSGNIINKTIANNTYPYTASTKGKFKLDNDVLAKAQSDYKKKNIDLNELLKIYDTATSDKHPNITFGEYRASKRGSTGRIPEPSDITPSYDALFLQQGLPQKYNSFEEAKYLPSKRTGSLNTIYKFNSKWEEDLWKDLSEYGNSDFLESNETVRYVKGSHVAGASLKNFIYSKGKDDRGEYVSYYDKNDYDNILDYIPNSETFDIYGRLYYKDYGDGQKKRMYYTDKELSELDINKKNFDTLALQRELSNRGYKLPNSTKEDGSFDGIFGEETLNALKKWQEENK